MMQTVCVWLAGWWADANGTGVTCKPSDCSAPSDSLMHCSLQPAVSFSKPIFWRGGICQAWGRGEFILLLHSPSFAQAGFCVFLGHRAGARWGVRQDAKCPTRDPFPLSCCDWAVRRLPCKKAPLSLQGCPGADSVRLLWRRTPQGLPGSIFGMLSYATGPTWKAMSS